MFHRNVTCPSAHSPIVVEIDCTPAVNLQYHGFVYGQSDTVLDDDDDETPIEASDQDQEASEQNPTASAATTMASERQQVGSEHDQNAEHDQHENISGPALRDQNHENVCATNAAVWDHNNENVGDMKGTQDHNNKSVFGTNTRSGGKNRKQMTY